MIFSKFRGHGGRLPWRCPCIFRNPAFFRADLFSPEQLHLDAMEFELNRDQHLKLTEEDMIDLKDLKIRQLEQFGPEITHQIALSLVDILFGFLYDLRTTLVGEIQGRNRKKISGGGIHRQGVVLHGDECAQSES